MPSFYEDSLNVSPMNASPKSLSNAINSTKGPAVTINRISTDEKNKLQLSEVEFKDKKVPLPKSIFKDTITVNYRTLKSTYADLKDERDNEYSFTEYSDYKTCMKDDAEVQAFLKDRDNPTVENIMKYYNGSTNALNAHGLCRYRLQDFIFCKDYGVIPNNRLITLRRYTMPTFDTMFGFDMSPTDMNLMNRFAKNHSALSTACTYINDDNKISELLKMTFGQEWEPVHSEVQTLQDPRGSMVDTFDKWIKKIPAIGKSMSDSTADVIAKGLTSTATGISASELTFNAKNKLKDAFYQNYPDGLYNGVNRIESVMRRKPGLKFSHEIKLTFRYSLKSLQYVNPKIAFLDLMSNFMLLTGNYGTFWGGSIHWTGSPAAPTFGDPELLVQGKYGEYVHSVFDDISASLNRKNGGGAGKKSFMELATEFIKGSAEALLANILGEGQNTANAQVPKALLKSDPVGLWHLVIGNPLNPIAVIGNLCVSDIEMSFNDVLGRDDFPTELTFVVTLQHGLPRDIASVQSMFNAGHGRIYVPIETKQGRGISGTGKDDQFPMLNATIEEIQDFKKFSTS